MAHVREAIIPCQTNRAVVDEEAYEFAVQQAADCASCAPKAHITDSSLTLKRRTRIDEAVATDRSEGWVGGSWTWVRFFSMSRVHAARARCSHLTHFGLHWRKHHRGRMKTISEPSLAPKTLSISAQTYHSVTSIQATPTTQQGAVVTILTMHPCSHWVLCIRVHFGEQ